MQPILRAADSAPPSALDIHVMYRALVLLEIVVFPKGRTTETHAWTKLSVHRVHVLFRMRFLLECSTAAGFWALERSLTEVHHRDVSVAETRSIRAFDRYVSRRNGYEPSSMHSTLNGNPVQQSKWICNTYLWSPSCRGKLAAHSVHLYGRSCSPQEWRSQ